MNNKPKPNYWLYGAFVVAVIVAAYLNWPQPAATKRPTTIHSSLAKVTDVADGILPEDYKAHFPRVPIAKRNPFLPLVSSGASGSMNNGQDGSQGNWSLTGINVVNGVRNAVIENSGTGDSVYLAKGEQWNNLTVTQIGSESVTFQDPVGQQTTMTFITPKGDENQTLQSNPVAPSLNQIMPLPTFGQPSSVQAQQQVPSDTTYSATQRRGRRYAGFGQNEGSN